MRLPTSLLCLVLLGSAAAAHGADAPAAAEPAKPKAGGSFAATDKTNIDFGETLIDGKMQAPQGFFLQGRQAQSMSQMVRLRSKFRSELRNSKSAVKALVK